MSGVTQKVLAERIRNVAVDVEQLSSKLFDLATDLDGSKRVDINDLEKLEREQDERED